MTQTTKRKDGFFDATFDKLPASAPKRRPRVEKGMIKGVPFVDSPKEGDEKEPDPDDFPYVPSAREWKDLKADMKYLAFSAGIAIGFGALGLIFAICSLVTK